MELSYSFLASKTEANIPYRPPATAAVTAQATPKHTSTCVSYALCTSVFSMTPLLDHAPADRRQLFSTRLLSAIFSPSLLHMGDVSCSFASCC